jgi:hypothetical protein
MQRAQPGQRRIPGMDSSDRKTSADTTSRRARYRNRHGFRSSDRKPGIFGEAFDSIHIAGNLEEAQEGREGSKGKALQGGGIPVSPHFPHSSRSSRPHRSGPAGPDGPPGATGASGLSGGQIWSANFQLPASIASASFSNQVVALPAAARHRKPTGTSQAWNSTRWLSN